MIVGDTCLDPCFDSVLLLIEWKEALWDRFYAGCALAAEAARREIKNSQDKPLRSLAL